jgi:D-sedoheptulose 7-phosphate isomerase
MRSESDLLCALQARSELLAASRAAAAVVLEAGRVLSRVLGAGGTVWACGNGGSATQAQHLVAELVGRFRRERGAMRAFCLSDNAATVTAVANDYEFADVFARQVRGLARAGDCLVALSTSGSSENVVRACRAARAAGVSVVAMTGESGGRVAKESDVVIRVPAADTPRIQEAHLVVIHLLCEIVDTIVAEAGDHRPVGR